MARQDADGGERGPIHAEVLAAARRLCRRGSWTFRLRDVVRALPHRNERTVRTHVVSRCCANAPKNHAHRWPYFDRVGWGVYEIRPPFRGPRSGGRAGDTAAQATDAIVRQSAIHAVVSESEGWYVAECLEVAVVTQGRSLDEMMANLRSALALHLSDDERARAGLPQAPRLVVNYETAALGL